MHALTDNRLKRDLKQRKCSRNFQVFVLIFVNRPICYYDVSFNSWLSFQQLCHLLWGLIS